MTQAQLDRSVAAPHRRVAPHRPPPRLPARPGRPDLEPEDLRLVVDCPFCGRAVPYPGRAGDGSPALAECLDPRCDVYFDFDPAEVYAARPWAPPAAATAATGSPLIRPAAGHRVRPIRPRDDPDPAPSIRRHRP